MLAMPDAYSNQIKSLSGQLAEAVHDAHAARRTVETEEAYQQKIAARVADLAAQRETIVTRRAGGTHAAADAADLALIQADAEGLATLLHEAAQKVAEAQRVHGEHASRAAALRQQIAEVQALAKRDALVAYLSALGEKMQEGLAVLAEAAQVTGYTGKPLWTPPAPLYAALRKLAAQSGIL